MAEKPPPPYAVLAVCATVIIISLVAGLVALVIYAPPGTDVVAIITAAGAAVVAAGGSAASWAKAHQVARGQAVMDAKVTDLGNGKMDAKIRAAVADVMHPDTLNPAAADQLVADRARRDQH